MKEPRGKQYLQSLWLCFCPVLQVLKKGNPTIETEAFCQELPST